MKKTVLIMAVLTAGLFLAGCGSGQVKSADDFAKEGINAMYQGNYEQALKCFNSGLKVNSSSLSCLCFRSSTYMSMGEYEKSVEDCSRVLEIAPDHQQGLYNRAMSWTELGEYENAIADWTALIKINPDSEFYSERGYCYLKTGNLKQCAADCTSSLKLKPSNINSLKNRAFAYILLKENAKAAADYTTAIKLDPSNPDMYCSRSAVYVSSKNYKKALADVKKAQELAPDRDYSGLCDYLKKEAAKQKK